MKKILFIIVGLFIFTSTANAAEEILLENNIFIPTVLTEAKTNKDSNPITLNKIDNSEIKLESQATRNNSIPTYNPSGDYGDIQCQQQHKIYEGISNTIRNVYDLQIENTNTPSYLLKDPLTHHFEKGPLDSFHFGGVVQANIGTKFAENTDTDTNFKVGLINIITEGKFKSQKENFKLIFDPTPQHNRGFMQQFIQDLFIETHRIPHNTLLIGNSRPGVGYEGAQSPYTLPLLNRSQISRNFANVRKFGIRLKGDYSLMDYDLGGYSSDTFFTEFFPGAEFNGWVNFKPLGKTDGRYGKLVTGGGIVAGQRHATDFFVAGAYVGYEYKKMWARMEYANANGSN